MITLYHGSGSQEIEVQDTGVGAERWDALRSVCCKMLRAKGLVAAAKFLDDIPFEVRDGTNGFGDDFAVLYWSAPFDRYLEIASWGESRVHFGTFKQIAETVSEIAKVYIRFVAVELDTNEGPATVTSPTLQITSDVVERALKDAERLMSDSGATSGLDRVHTALHGYLIAVCDKHGFSHSTDPSITELFKIVKQQHPAFSSTVAQAGEIQKVVNAFANVVDALNPVRNRGSMAHPNTMLLAEAEAMLVINAVRTLLHYLNAKIG